MSLTVNTLGRGRERFPRVSGDEPPADLQWLDSQKFSPRERG